MRKINNRELDEMAEVIKQCAARIWRGAASSVLDNLILRLSFRYVLDARLVCKHQTKKRGSAKPVSTVSRSWLLCSLTLIYIHALLDIRCCMT